MCGVILRFSIKGIYKITYGFSFVVTKHCPLFNCNTHSTPLCLLLFCFPFYNTTTAHYISIFISFFFSLFLSIRLLFCLPFFIFIFRPIALVVVGRREIGKCAVETIFVNAIIVVLFATNSSRLQARNRFDVCSHPSDSLATGSETCTRVSKGNEQLYNYYTVDQS